MRVFLCAPALVETIWFVGTGGTAADRPGHRDDSLPVGSGEAFVIAA